VKLGKLIELLKEIDPTKVVANGFGMARSYRGCYEDLAFEDADTATIGAMLDYAQAAMGREFGGYKGGWYKATAETKCWIADWGETVDGPIQLYNLIEWRDSPCLSELRWSKPATEETETEAIPPTFEELHQERSRAPRPVPDDKAFLLDRLSEIMADRAEIEALLAEAEAAKGAFVVRSLDNRRRLRMAYWELSNYLGGTKTIKVGNHLLQGTDDREGVIITPIDLELPLASSEGRDETSI
jgi:hypothetical protein